MSTWLPGRTLGNDELAAQFPGWSAEKIEAKTGIHARRIAAPGQTALDLGERAARALLAAIPSSTAQRIDFLLLCTQTPDHFLPTSACLLQRRLGLPRTVGALDINLGCSGFVYGLSIAAGMIASCAAGCVLVITADTYTKLLGPEDRGSRTLFGDGAAATLVERADADAIGPFVFGTDGAGAPNLIVDGGAFRRPGATPRLAMNGPEIFRFTLDEVPKAVAALLAKAGSRIDDIDLVVLHQANAFMLEHLRAAIGVASERFVVDLADIGNTVSSSIPFAMTRAAIAARLRPGMRVLLVGFGVGYSWAACLVTWPADVVATGGSDDQPTS